MRRYYLRTRISPGATWLTPEEEFSNDFDCYVEAGRKLSEMRRAGWPHTQISIAVCEVDSAEVETVVEVKRLGYEGSEATP